MARQNVMLAVCIVALFAQASAQWPVSAPMTTPEMAPLGAPITTPELAPIGAPILTPEMAPIASPALAPLVSPVEAPVAAPGPDVALGPGPAPIMSGAARNVVSSFAVVAVGFAAFLLH